MIAAPGNPLIGLAERDIASVEVINNSGKMKIGIIARPCNLKLGI